MTIVVALKKEFRIPGEREPEGYTTDFDLNVDLYQRIIYLLKNLGFSDKDIPKFCLKEKRYN